ncbi:MAG: glycoside hydrolase family 43 protein [Clostridia bacterium]|nr:glycoside hydrolase family 43 protein [Clostridia bacterium]
MITCKNPINDGWYADPEARFYEGEYWIYATRSRKYPEQMNLDAFHSADGEHWEKAEGIIDMSGFPHVYQAVWAPTIIDKDGKYYLVFATNDIHSDDTPGGLEIAVSDTPAGPFRAFLPDHGQLVGTFINGAQPIDAHLFKDDDGTIYLYYGGWRHCNVGVMKDDMTGVVPFEDGTLFKEITPPDYVEGPCMLKRNGQYYFMWSVGGWGNDSYGVCYGVCDSPFGPFEKDDQILKTDYDVAKGPGHHGYLQDHENPEDWYIVYHRRPLTETDCNSRQLCIDKMIFGDKMIEKIKMT